jgi:uncharacterized protein (TIGR03435 family)
MSRLIRFPLLLLAVCALAGSSTAQTPPAQPQSAATAAPVFDIAAIHVYLPDQHEHSHIWILPFESQFKAQNVSLIALIHWAFEMPETRILSAPGWAGTTRFSIDAKADSSVDVQMHNLTADAARAQQKRMVQALLADRFKLATHTETRDLPIYELVVAKGGPRLSPPDANGAFINHGRDHIEINGYTNGVSALAEELSKEVGRDVVDKTSVTGSYHLQLTWSPDDRATPAASGANPASPASDTGPSIFTALEEQLGLRLEPSKGPVQVLVIDHAESPSAN